MAHLNQRQNNPTKRDENAIILKRSDHTPIPFLKTPGAEPISNEDIVSFIKSQHVRASHRVFRPFPFSMEQAVTWRANSSDIMRWTMFAGAKIVQAMLDGTSKEQYANWINRFHGRVLASVDLNSEISALRARLSSLQDLSLFYRMVSHTPAGYSMFKKSVPVFIQLVSRHPHLWTRDSAISLNAVLHAKGFDIPRFAFFDTIYSLAFGVVPLIHYDTNQPRPADADHFQSLEWVFGCPPDIVVTLAKVNAWRASKWLEQAIATPKANEWREIEEQLKAWRPTVEHIDEPSNVVARLAVFEGWRQAALIYLYMGMCGVNSADPRVESSVHQIVQLAYTIQPGASPEPYMMLPCLIAGVAARLEKHRAAIYNRMSASQSGGILVLRGSDFLPVMDNLWHGAGTGGTAIVWEDYVRARSAGLPLDI
ncbi:hypothetical protein FS749_016642 [Ceratobasidium sp. UAMH 11750]|nr:hypothetical protein FS749_016642 [Ceratobasidium sp. UAMH 11750]